MDDMQPEDNTRSTLFTWLLAAAKEGHPAAQCAVAKCYWDGGEDLNEDPEEAVRWFNEAAANGHPEAQRYLGWAYSAGIGVVADRATARSWLEASADLGNAGAMRDLYHLLAEEDADETRLAAREALHRAALADEIVAQLLMGDLAVREQQDSVGERAAAAWWWCAARQGHAVAQHRLARACWQGRGVPQSADSAIHWLQTSAEQGGFAPAQSDLGSLLLARAETPQAVALAKTWLCRAAAQGEGVAYYMLGEHSLKAGDADGAIPWLHEAARKGVAVAQQLLGECLLDGRGVAADPVQGCVWLHQAAANGLGLGEEGYTNALSRLEAATATLTPEQQDAVQEKLRALRQNAE